jgi:hypothetical protein
LGLSSLADQPKHLEASLIFHPAALPLFTPSTQPTTSHSAMLIMIKRLEIPSISAFQVFARKHNCADADSDVA